MLLFRSSKLNEQKANLFKSSNQTHSLQRVNHDPSIQKYFPETLSVRFSIDETNSSCISYFRRFQKNLMKELKKNISAIHKSSLDVHQCMFNIMKRNITFNLRKISKLPMVLVFPHTIVLAFLQNDHLRKISNRYLVKRILLFKVNQAKVYPRIFIVKVKGINKHEARHHFSF